MFEVKDKATIEMTRLYFLFLRSTPLFLGSFFGKADPEGMAYCIGESAEAAGEGTGPGEGADKVVGGPGGGGTGVGIDGAALGSGRGLGRICFNRLFR